MTVAYNGGCPQNLNQIMQHFSLKFNLFPALCKKINTNFCPRKNKYTMVDMTLCASLLEKEGIEYVTNVSYKDMVVVTFL